MIANGFYTIKLAGTNLAIARPSDPEDPEQRIVLQFGVNRHNSEWFVENVGGGLYNIRDVVGNAEPRYISYPFPRVGAPLLNMEIPRPWVIQSTGDTFLIFAPDNRFSWGREKDGSVDGPGPMVLVEGASPPWTFHRV